MCSFFLFFPIWCNGNLKSTKRSKQNKDNEKKYIQKFHVLSFSCFFLLYCKNVRFVLKIFPAHFFFVVCDFLVRDMLLDALCIVVIIFALNLHQLETHIIEIQEVQDIFYKRIAI